MRWSSSRNEEQPVVRPSPASKEPNPEEQQKETHPTQCLSSVVDSRRGEEQVAAIHRETRLQFATVWISFLAAVHDAMAREQAV